MAEGLERVGREVPGDVGDQVGGAEVVEAHRAVGPDPGDHGVGDRLSDRVVEVRRVRHGGTACEHRDEPTLQRRVRRHVQCHRLRVVGDADAAGHLQLHHAARRTYPDAGEQAVGGRRPRPRVEQALRRRQRHEVPHRRRRTARIVRRRHRDDRHHHTRHGHRRCKATPNRRSHFPSPRSDLQHGSPRGRCQPCCIPALAHSR